MTITSLQDDRPIFDITDHEAGINWYTVGTKNVTKIEIYGEEGQMSYIPTIAVYFSDEPLPRIRRALGNLTVTYF